ncbi:hypothetical protein RSIPO_05005 [Ralstonia solanacearum IPO1609]|uniref:Uncharacterized protein n=1 Tax=Ralstonia solanacearum IPO1609 TaxID=564066 RepID=A0ABF7RE89_RALSL|nr:hypothetical protein RSIPO_05005 [Ralstonia solanacearum IPO1609]
MTRRSVFGARGSVWVCTAGPLFSHRTSWLCLEYWLGAAWIDVLGSDLPKPFRIGSATRVLGEATANYLKRKASL